MSSRSSEVIQKQHFLLGDYSPESLLEMIALHVDATYANENTWGEFSLCFLKLAQYDEDRMSVCLNGNGSKQKQRFSVHYNRLPIILTEGKSGKSWMLHCKWWLNQHFSNKMLTSEIAAGDLQLLTYKAACASHMYGQQCDYFVKDYAYLEKSAGADARLKPILLKVAWVGADVFYH